MSNDTQVLANELRIQVNTKLGEIWIKIKNYITDYGDNMGKQLKQIDPYSQSKNPARKPVHYLNTVDNAVMNKVHYSGDYIAYTAVIGCNEADYLDIVFNNL